MLYRKHEAKDWARNAYRGFDTTILPCFTPDTLALDEAGIRYDMRLPKPTLFGWQRAQLRQAMIASGLQPVA